MAIQMYGPVVLATVAGNFRHSISNVPALSVGFPSHSINFLFSYTLFQLLTLLSLSTFSVGENTY